MERGGRRCSKCHEALPLDQVKKPVHTQIGGCTTIHLLECSMTKGFKGACPRQPGTMVPGLPYKYKKLDSQFFSALA